MLAAVALFLLVSVQPIRNDDDETVLSLISFRDVTTQQCDVIDSGVTSSVVDGTKTCGRESSVTPYVAYICC